MSRRWMVTVAEEQQSVVLPVSLATICQDEKEPSKTPPFPVHDYILIRVGLPEG